MKKLFIILLLCIFITGCQHGPNSNVIKDEIQKNLDVKFQKGLFKIETLSRNGSYPFKLNDNSDGLLIYFKSRIKFLKDYNLTKWDKLNSATLSSILGSTQLGINGIVKSGNKKNDILKVFGTFTFKSKNGKWIPTSFSKTESKSSKKEKQFVSEAYNELNQLGKRIKKIKSSKKLISLKNKFVRNIKKVNLLIDKTQNITSFSSGVKGGVYYSIGKGLSKAFNKKNIKFSNYSSTGSKENCQMVNDNYSDFSVSQADIAYMASKGKLLFTKPMSDIRAICSLYPESIQIIVRKDSGLKNISDLKGKKINIGQIGSGTRINALFILKMNHLSLNDFSSVDSNNIYQSVKKFKEGKIDAFFTTWACPSDIIKKLADEIPVNCLSIQNIDLITKTSPYLFPITIPKNTYNGLDKDVNTLGVTAILITNKNVESKKISTMLKILFQSNEILRSESNMADFISKETAMKGISIKIHPDAKKYFSKPN